MTNITPTTRITHFTQEVADAILEMVRPQIGAFDVESGDAWKTLKGEIEAWLENGDYDGETVAEIAAEVRDEFGAQIALIGNGPLHEA